MYIQRWLYGFNLPLRSALLIFILLASATPVISQCSGFPATTADANCNGGTALASGQNINSGSYGYCGSPSASASFNNINLSGGIIRICGNATLAFSAYNSGIIVVSCGSTLTVNSSLTLNSNSGIVNYGTVIINGSLTFQNSNNYFYNELASSKLTVTGSMNFNANSGNTGYVKNAGYIKVNGSYNALDGCYTCFLNGGQMECGNLVYMDHNGNCNGVSGNKFTFGSASGSCILRYISSASLYNVFTSDSHWNVYQASGSSQTIDPPCNGHATGWGSAVITANAPALIAPSGTQSCSTITCLTLAVQLLGFEAQPVPEGVLLEWATASEQKSKGFAVERSFDAQSWAELAQVKGAGNSVVKINYSYTDLFPGKGLNYYRLKLMDEGGTASYSNIVMAASQALNSNLVSTVFPNPANTSEIDMRMKIQGLEPVVVDIWTMPGEKIASQTAFPGDAQEGVTELHISLPNSGQLFLITISQKGIMLDKHKVCVIRN